MIYKKALMDSVVSTIKSDLKNNNIALVKTASGRVLIEPNSEKAKIVEAEISKHPNALFFRAKAIEADAPNSNGDYFSEEELLKAYKSFEGVPFFTNHDNQNIENARGKIIFAEWIPEEKACYTIAFVDRDAYPHICRSIEEEYVTGVSMGCSVEYSVCNICENRAEKTDQYCFVPGTTITMSDLSIKNIEDIIVGDKVLDAYGNQTTVTELFIHNVSETLQSLTSKAICGELTCTKSHPFLVERRDKLTYIPCEYLVEKETLLMPIPKIEEDNSLFNIFSKYEIENSEKNRLMVSKFIGYYIAEGSLIHNSDKIDIGTAISLNSEEVEYRDEIINICKEIIGKTPEVVDRNNYNHKSVELRIYHPFIVELIKLTCTGLAKHKILSEKVLSLNKIYLQEMLAGYIDGDGHSDSTGRLVITTASKNLASQLLYLFTFLGVAPSIYSYDQNNGPNDREGRTLIFKISIGNLNTIKLNSRSTKINKSQLIAQKSPKINTVKTNFSIGGFVKHTSYNIEEVEYSGPVYNFETESHSYVANNTSVHNCSHIRDRKGRKFSGKARNVVTGEINEFKDQKVWEYNYGLKFIELSAVVDPACPSCHIQGIINKEDYLKRVASIENSLYMVKSAAMEKNASKEEIDQIEQVLETLEGIAVNLIKNRKQVEMEFASDLVDILSNLQTWLDELVGAGYGNLQGGVPGSSEEVPASPEEAPAQAPSQPAPAPALPPNTGTGVAGAVPAAAESPIAGTPSAITGAPGKAPVQSPKLPMAKPTKPRAAGIGSSMSIQRVADEIFESGKQVLTKAANLNDKMNKTGEINMAKRRTLAEKTSQTDKTKEVLSSLWKEKQQFFEYIKEVPSLQDNEHKLSVMKRDDTFIIVAEKKSQSREGDKMVWTYENLTDNQKQLIKANPKEAAVKLLETFAKNLKPQKEGVKSMTDINKSAGATSINKAPEVITEKQLEQKGLYHSRTGDEAEQVTEAQLKSLRKGEQDVVTEKQLSSGIKLNPRTEESAEVVTEKQLEAVREGSEAEVVTQKQLEDNGNRVNNEQEVVTEKQLNNIAAPWARAAGRNPAMFKSAGDHMEGAIDVMADSAISAGCTPDEICAVAASMVDTTKNRYDLATSILESDKIGEKVDFAKRAAFWNNQNLKIASAGTKEIAKLIVDGLRKMASDKTINPEVLISAVDVIAEGGDALASISDKIKVKMASVSESKVKNIKNELREALKKAQPVTSTKEERDATRKEILASVGSETSKIQRESERKVWENILNKKAVKETNSDIVLETNFAEVGCQKNDPSFKKAIVGFTKGALSAQNIKVATITNVTISGDTIQIAVQSDEGNEEVEIPVGDQSMPSPEETMPEGDLSGEGLESTMGSAPAPATPAPTTASSKKMTKVAQTPPGGAMGGQPGGVSAPGDSAQGLPGHGGAGGDAVQALTTGDEGEEVGEDIPTVGQQQMPWTTCPECGKSDVDVTNEDGDIKGKCNNPDCGAEYDAMIKKEIEFKITKPSKLMSGEGTAEAPEMPEAAPEVPAMPVAAQTRIDKNSIVRIAKNKKQFGHVCPACGKTDCKVTKDEDSHTEFTCEACGTDSQKDILLSASNPEVGFLRVKWDIVPNLKGCKDCADKVARFASRIKVEKLFATAAEKAGSFPMSNCIERIARVYGGNTVGTFGPCKGKVLAECACKELQKLGFTKVRQLQKFAEASMAKDPMEECIKDQSKKGHSIKEASSICNCLKKKYASKASDNIYAIAFGKDVVDGVETLVTAKDLETIYDMQLEASESVVKEAAKIEADAEIGDALPPLKEATVEVEIVREAKEKNKTVVDKSDKESTKDCETCKKAIKDCVCKTTPDGTDGKKEVEAGTKKETKEMKEAKSELTDALQMNGQRVRKVSEEVVKVAAKPTVIEHIEKDVEAGVPRQEQYLGKEKEADSAINKTPAKPNVPRGEAYMGKEKDADSLINKKLELPDVAVDSSFIGDEARIQSGMPAINNELKGTVIASKDQATKEAKKMKEVDSVEGDVEAGVPGAPNGGKLGKEKDADSAINTPNKGPDVPTGKAYMGEEANADSLINADLKGPDVPIDSSYMGDEKNVQKGMPAINDEMLKVVKQQREDQLGKIAKAREMKAVKVAGYLLASKRIADDMDTYNSVVKALSSFEIDSIESVANKMFPEKTVKASVEAKKTVEAGHTIPAIVLESKTEGSEDSLQKRLASAFTIGNQKFDDSISRFGIK